MRDEPENRFPADDRDALAGELESWRDIAVGEAHRGGVAICDGGLAERSRGSLNVRVLDVFEDPGAGDLDRERKNLCFKLEAARV